MLVESVWSSTSNLPAKVPDPPEFIFSATPKPPSITTAPEEGLVEVSVLSTSNLPAITPEPPMFIFLSIPTPPDTTNDPLDVEVLCCCDCNSVWSPTINLFTIPTPPSIWTEALVVLDASVVSLNVVRPSTSKVLFNWTAPFTFNVASNCTFAEACKSPLTSNW